MKSEKHNRLKISYKNFLLWPFLVLAFIFTVIIGFDDLWNLFYPTYNRKLSKANQDMSHEALHKMTD